MVIRGSMQPGRAQAGAWKTLGGGSTRRVERLWLAVERRLAAADTGQDGGERFAEDGSATAEALKFFGPEF